MVRGEQNWPVTSYLPWLALKSIRNDLKISRYSVAKIESLLQKSIQFYQDGFLYRAFAILEKLLYCSKARPFYGLIYFYRGIILKELSILNPASRSFLSANQLLKDEILQDLTRYHLIQLALWKNEENTFFSQIKDIKFNQPKEDIHRICELVEESFEVFPWLKLIDSYQELLELFCQKNVDFDSLLPFVRTFHTRIIEQGDSLQEYLFYEKIERNYSYQHIPFNYRKRYDELKLNYHFEMANQNIENGEYDKAREFLEKILSSTHFSKLHEETLFLLGYLHYFHLGNTKKAKWYLMQTNNPIALARNPKIGLYLAMIFEEELKREKALKILNKIQKYRDLLSPEERAIFHFSYINALMLNHQKKSASQYFQKIKKSKSFKDSPYFLLSKNALN
ncbi:tetratricopeptide repeat protein [Candidatus Riflebacteria bacterium]